MQPFHPYGHPPRQAPLPPPPVLPTHDPRAFASLVLGVMSMTCAGFLAGIPAIIMGSMARRDIDRSGGIRTGSGVAAAGIVTGLFGTGLSLVILLATLGGAIGKMDPPEPRTQSPVPGVPIAAGTRSYGSLDVVDLEGDKALKAQVQEIARAAAAKGRTVILQTYVRESKECAEVALALPDTRMQKALANVTLIRADIDAFEAELKAMRVDTESVPWFYKLDANARPIDAISADEWDANIAENMAPVLADFAAGRPRPRKTPSPLGTAL
ncbi:MAG: DUF4190 domain-containing protein [Deltaproteobacteria bacterium]|nr:DUF4190 domain-containing protein [Deltaproteobacteria bacterium]